MDDVDKLRRSGWICVACRGTCKCRRCKSGGYKSRSSDSLANNFQDVISYRIKGKPAFQIDNFVIIENGLQYNRKAKKELKHLEKLASPLAKKRKCTAKKYAKVSTTKKVKEVDSKLKPVNANNKRSDSEYIPYSDEPQILTNVLPKPKYPGTFTQITTNDLYKYFFLTH